MYMSDKRCTFVSLCAWYTGFEPNWKCTSLKENAAPGVFAITVLIIHIWCVICTKNNCCVISIVNMSYCMLKECIESKDSLNQRYLRKRALYLTYIAAHLTKYEIISSVEFSHHNGNHMKPILIVTPQGMFLASICLTSCLCFWAHVWWNLISYFWAHMSNCSMG